MEQNSESFSFKDTDITRQEQNPLYKTLQPMYENVSKVISILYWVNYNMNYFQEFATHRNPTCSEMMAKRSSLGVLKGFV